MAPLPAWLCRSGGPIPWPLSAPSAPWAVRVAESHPGRHWRVWLVLLAAGDGRDCRPDGPAGCADPGQGKGRHRRCAAELDGRTHRGAQEPWISAAGCRVLRVRLPCDVYWHPSAGFRGLVWSGDRGRRHRADDHWRREYSRNLSRRGSQQPVPAEKSALADLSRPCGPDRLADADAENRTDHLFSPGFLGFCGCPQCR